jgi:transcriptional regulator with XRE-family HTH domain
MAAEIDYKRSTSPPFEPFSIVRDRMKIQTLTPTIQVLKELGLRLARLRKQQGLSQEELAAAAGVGVATLRRLEDGKDGKLGSWSRLLLALHQDAALDQLLPEEVRSPLAEVKGKRAGRTAANARPKPAPRGGPEEPDTMPRDDAPGFVWGDQRR